MTGEKYRGFMARQGFNWMYQPPDDFREYLKEADGSLGALIKSDAFKAIRRAQFGPMVYPAVLGVGFLFVLSFLVVGRVKKSEVIEKPSLTGWIHLAEGIAVIVLFLVLLRPVGFVLTTGVLLGLFLWRLGTKPWVSILISGILVSGAYTIFKVLLRVDLPQGLLAW